MENILLKVHSENAYAQGRSLLKGYMMGADLYFTNKRIICIDVGNPGLALAIGGLAGFAFSKLKHRGKRGNKSLADLDKLIKEDKNSFEIKYSDIEKIELKPILLFYSLSITAQGKAYNATLTRKYAKEVRTILNETVPSLLDND